MGKTIRREKTPDDDEELTVITKMHAPRVDLVGAPANGIDFLMAKSAAGLISPEEVLELAKRAESTADINDLPDSDFAYIEPGGEKDDTGKTTPRSLRHFPIMDAAHVRNALARASSSPFGEKAMPKIKAAAGKLGIDQDMTKADDDTVDVDPIDDSDVDASGDVNDPDSAAWEALDAARAAQAIELTVALRNALQVAQAREEQEALLGDDIEDQENAWNLAAALDATDCILAVLAPFAVTEQAEADIRDDDSVVLKSGRVLSGMNEVRIRQASDLLTEVLQSLPAESVVKAEDLAESVVKADDGEKSQLTLVYDAEGNILGAVDPDSITTFAPTPSGDASGDDTDPGATDDAATDATDAPPDASQADTPDAPADASDERKIPGTDTVQSPAEEDVTKGQQSELRAALEDALAPLRKALEERDERIEAMQKRLDEFGKKPDDRNSPVRNGATGAVQEVARGALINDEVSLIKQAQEEPDPMVRQPMLHQILKGRL